MKVWRSSPRLRLVERETFISTNRKEITDLVARFPVRLRGREPEACAAGYRYLPEYDCFCLAICGSVFLSSFLLLLRPSVVLICRLDRVA